jgi:hypothetical protein
VCAGSVTDYIIRLAPCSVFIIKNWRTVPKEHEPATYVVLYAVGSVAALLQLQLCCSCSSVADTNVGMLCSTASSTGHEQGSSKYSSNAARYIQYSIAPHSWRPPGSRNAATNTATKQKRVQLLFLLSRFNSQDPLSR